LGLFLESKEKTETKSKKLIRAPAINGPTIIPRLVAESISPRTQPIPQSLPLSKANAVMAGDNTAQSTPIEQLMTSSEK
jgi:hypothetical protein